MISFWRQLRRDRCWRLGFLLVLYALGRIASGATHRPGDDPPFEFDLNDSVWWTQLGDTAAVVLSLGPSYPSGENRWTRRWVLIIHAPQTSESLSCLQGLLDYDDAQPLWAKGSSFRVQISPRPGCTWGSITAADELEATVEGLGS